jgi:hypothetical protein
MYSNVPREQHRAKVMLLENSNFNKKRYADIESAYNRVEMENK